MEGFAEARFYGTGDNAADELGGTFAMIDSASEQYYYGVFGGKQNTSTHRVYIRGYRHSDFFDAL